MLLERPSPHSKEWRISIPNQLLWSENRIESVKLKQQVVLLRRQLRVHTRQGPPHSQTGQQTTGLDGHHEVRDLLVERPR